MKSFFAYCLGGAAATSDESSNGKQQSSSSGIGGGDSSPKRRASSSPDATSGSYPVSLEDLSLTLANSNLHAFTLAELKAATRNFTNSNFIGSGGFGPVYKGHVDDKLRPGLKSQFVAVKSLDLEGAQGHREWLAEVVFLGQLSHHHLVKLVGYCCEDEHRMLVYEYMARGSLEHHLFKRLLAALPWSTRLKIAVGAAKGLAFLHGSKKPVIYRDFKASNILLDSDYTAKLSDFGLAKDGPQGDDTHVSTRVMGTHGYAAPEYILTGHLTAKSDVYSFGVVLLELLSGRRSVDKMRPGREKNLVDWARPYLNNPDRLSRVMDPNLEGQYSTKGAQKAAAVAYKCLSQNPKSRPDMHAVVESLEPLLELKDVPLGPFVYVAPGEKQEQVQEQEQEQQPQQSNPPADDENKNTTSTEDKDESKQEADDKEEEHHQSHSHSHSHSHHGHHNHDHRHKRRFPNSAIHSELTLHRDGNSLYKNSLMHHKTAHREESQDRGA